MPSLIWRLKNIDVNVSEVFFLLAGWKLESLVLIEVVLYSCCPWHHLQIQQIIVGTDYSADV